MTDDENKTKEQLIQELAELRQRLGDVQGRLPSEPTSQQAEALRESETRLRQLADGIEDVFAISDLESSSVLYASPAYERVWGRSLQQLYEDFRHWDAGIHPDDRLSIQEARVRLIEQGERYEEQYRVIHTDGTMRWVRSRVYPVFDAGGRVYRAVEIAQDITERKQQEEELRESDARFRQLADAIEDVFAITDMQNGSILYASPAYEQIWGRSVEDLYEDSKQWDEGIHPEDRVRIQESWTRIIERGERYEEQYRVIHTDGTMRWVRSRAYPILDEGGRVYRVVEIAHNITERKQQEEELSELLTKMETLAMTDSLTGLLNRRAIHQLATAEWNRIFREDSAMSLILIDVDHFKLVNDEHGHLIGDQVLRVVADTVVQNKRSYDMAGRWGGEEFLLVLPGATLSDAGIVAERIRVSVDALKLQLPGYGVLKVQVSQGVTRIPNETGSNLGLDIFMNQADDALYRAKKEGRNRVCFYGLDDPEK